jgi:hypothetical protein
MVFLNKSVPVDGSSTGQIHNRENFSNLPAITDDNSNLQITCRIN